MVVGDVITADNSFVRIRCGKFLAGHPALAGGEVPGVSRAGQTERRLAPGPAGFSLGSTQGRRVDPADHHHS